jgi:hypothetical protein
MELQPVDESPTPFPLTDEELVELVAYLKIDQQIVSEEQVFGSPSETEIS